MLFCLSYTYSFIFQVIFQIFYLNFIEMKKTRGGRVSEAQRAYLDMLTGLGYLAVVCNGWLEAKQIIEQYLNGKNHAQ